MGNQESRISSNYNIKNVVIENDYFSVLEAVSKKDSSEIVSIFRYKNKLNLSEKQGAIEDINAVLFKNAVQRIKTIRHPGIAKFINADIYSESPAIVTTNVIPLKSVLNDITPENLCTGIFNLLKTIEFLHQNCKLVYNNICLESIFVPKNNYTKWLIGEFQYSIPINASKSESQKIIDIIPSRLQPSKEEKESNSFYRDYWLMGKLIEKIIEPFINKKEKKSNTINWVPLKQIAIKMQDAIPQNRKSITEAINEPFFNNNIVIEVLEYLKNYKIRDENDKKHYLSILPNKLKLMSNDIIEKNILPEIIQKEIINESYSDILFVELFKDPLQGNSLISEECYKNKIIPYILEMIKLHQWGTRIVLLKLIDSYYDAIIRYDTEDNKNKELLITEVLVGLEDMDQDIYINSFAALTKILKKTKLKNDNGSQMTNDKNNNDEIGTNIGSRKNSTANDKSQTTIIEKNDNSYLSVNVLINRFIIPHFIRMQISDNKEQKLESMKHVVELWKHYIRIEKDDIEVGQVAKSINVNILKTMKFIVKLFKIDELSSIINDIFLKDILNNHNSFGYYYVSSYIMPLLVTHLPRTSMDLRNNEINILQTLLDYLSKCSQPYLIEEDTSSNVKKLKNMYSNKFQSLEKYHFVKAGPIRKAERSSSRTNLSTASNSSFDLSSKNNSKSDLVEEKNRKNSSDLPPKKKNSYKAEPLPIDDKNNYENSMKAQDVEWNNEIINNDEINDFESENNDFNKSLSSPKKNNKPTASMNSWDNFEIKTNNSSDTKNIKSNDGWNFDWSDEENDNSMNVNNEKIDNFNNDKDTNTTTLVIPENTEKGIKNEQISPEPEKQDNDVNKDEVKKIESPIKTHNISIGNTSKSNGTFTKSPMKMSSMKSMKLGHKKENKESSLKKKLNDLNKMQQLKSQKKKEDNIKMKEIEDIMSLISNDSPNTPQKKTPISSKSNSLLSLNNSDKLTQTTTSTKKENINVNANNKHKILSDFNSITNEETDLINNGWDDLDDLDNSANNNSNSGWGEIQNVTKNDNITNEWEFNNDFNDISVPGINNDLNNLNVKSQENNNAWEFNTDFEIPELSNQKDINNNNNNNNAWDFNTDFDIPKIPETNEIKMENNQTKINDSWDFNDDFSIPEVKENKMNKESIIKETKKDVNKQENESSNAWDFNEDFNIPEIKEEKKIEEPVVDETKNDENKQINEFSNAWDINEDLNIPEIKEEKKIEESVVDETKNDENEQINKSYNAWDINEDLNIPEIKEEKKIEEPVVDETKNDENKQINESSNAWDINEDLNIPEIKEEKKIEEPVIEETKNDENEQINESSNPWDINEDLNIPEIKEEKKFEEPVIEETKNDENKKINESSNAWDINENLSIPEIKEEKKIEEPIVEETKNDENKQINESSNAWDINEDLNIPEIKEEKKIEESIAKETKNDENEQINESSNAWDINEDLNIPEIKEEKKFEETSNDKNINEPSSAWDFNNENLNIQEIKDENKNENINKETSAWDNEPSSAWDNEKAIDQSSSWDFDDNLNIPELNEEEKKVEETIKEEIIINEQLKNKEGEIKEETNNDKDITESSRSWELDNNLNASDIKEEKLEEINKKEGNIKEANNSEINSNKIGESIVDEVQEEEIIDKSLIEKSQKEKDKNEEPIVEKIQEKVENQSDTWEFNSDVKINNKSSEKNNKKVEKSKSIIEDVMEATKINPISDSESSVTTISIDESRKKTVEINKNMVEIPEDAEIIEEVIEVVKEVDEIDPNNPDLMETVEVVEELIEVKDGDEYSDRFNSGNVISTKKVVATSVTDKNNSQNIINEKMNENDVKLINLEDTKEIQTTNLINLEDEIPSPSKEEKIDNLIDLKTEIKSDVPSEVKPTSHQIINELNDNIIMNSNSWDFNENLELPNIPDLPESKENPTTTIKTEKELQEEKENKLIDELKNNSHEMLNSNSWDFDDDLELPDI